MSYLREVANAIRAEVPSSLVPARSEELFLIYAVLARGKGDLTTGEDVHDAWTAWMEMRAEQHEAMIPFGQLADSVQEEDAPFVAAIHAVTARMGGETRD